MGLLDVERGRGLGWTGLGSRARGVCLASSNDCQRCTDLEARTAAFGTNRRGYGRPLLMPLPTPDPLTIPTRNAYIGYVLACQPSMALNRPRLSGMKPLGLRNDLPSLVLPPPIHPGAATLTEHGAAHGASG